VNIYIGPIYQLWTSLETSDLRAFLVCFVVGEGEAGDWTRTLNQHSKLLIILATTDNHPLELLFLQGNKMVIFSFFLPTFIGIHLKANFYLDYLLVTLKYSVWYFYGKDKILFSVDTQRHLGIKEVPGWIQASWLQRPPFLRSMYVTSQWHSLEPLVTNSSHWPSIWNLL
jgi:hypothetical protein